MIKFADVGGGGIYQHHWTFVWLWSYEILSTIFLGQSEQMLLVALLHKTFPFGSTEIQEFRSTAQSITLEIPGELYDALRRQTKMQMEKQFLRCRRISLTTCG